MSNRGHNGIAGERLLSFVQRIERLEEEIAALNTDKREVYAEAKGVGFDKTIIRKIIQKRKMDPVDREEQDELFDLYWDAIVSADRGQRAPDPEPEPEPEQNETPQNDPPGETDEKTPIDNEPEMGHARARVHAHEAEGEQDDLDIPPFLQREEEE